MSGLFGPLYFDQIHSGLTSQKIAPYCKGIIGVDVSIRMVEEFNRKVADHGIPAEEMRAIHSLSPDANEPIEELQGTLFDVAIVSVACFLLVMSV